MTRSRPAWTPVVEGRLSRLAPILTAAGNVCNGSKAGTNPIWASPKSLGSHSSLGCRGRYCGLGIPGMVGIVIPFGRAGMPDGIAGIPEGIDGIPIGICGMALR